jgi:hypothetical protein
MKDEFTLPFLTRSMLDFQQGKQISIEVDIFTDGVSTFTLKGFTMEGPFQYNITTPAGISAGIYKFSVPDIPIILTLGTRFDGLPMNYAKATAYLAINASRYGVLLQGSLNGFNSLSWPNQLPFTEEQKRGRFGTYGLTPQAAGVELDDTISTLQWIKLKFIKIRLVAAVAAANRRLTLLVTPPGQQTMIFTTNVTQTSGQTKDYIFIESGATIDDQINNIIQTPLMADFWLTPGTRIQTLTANLNAGDQYTICFLQGEEYFSDLV